jgi:hypothetical protein
LNGESAARVPCGPTPYYADEWATIYHGDCREIDAWDVAGGVMVTDPPYGMGHRSGMAGAFGDCAVTGDEDTSVRDFVLTRWAPRPALVFGRWSVPKPEGTKAVLTWDKVYIGMGDLALPWGPSTEEIYVLGRGFTGRRGSSVIRFPSITGNTGQGAPWWERGFSGVKMTREHPTQKPLELMRHLIDRCPPQTEVVDPFMGSGTTLRAAKDCGRRSIGVEIEERYCEIAAKRLAQEVLDFGGVA